MLSLLKFLPTNKQAISEFQPQVEEQRNSAYWFVGPNLTRNEKQNTTEQTEKAPIFLQEERSIQPSTDEIQGKDQTGTGRFTKILDLSWEAWRHGQKVVQDHLSDVQTATSFRRRCAISEELEKHIWYKGTNLRKIRRGICIVEELTKYGLL